MILGSTHDPQGLLTSAWQRVLGAYRPGTIQAQRTHFKTFLSVLVFYDLPIEISAKNLLIFLEFLARNSISPKVVHNYFSSISSLSKFFNLDTKELSHPAVIRFLRGLSINSPFRPTPRGIFDIRTMYAISKAGGLLCIFQVLQHCPTLCSSVLQGQAFSQTGPHVPSPWGPPLQDCNSSHIVQLLMVDNLFLCPVRALQTLLQSRPLPPQAPLFAQSFPPYQQVIDTKVRDALKSILATLNILPSGHDFHTFRRSGATFAFDNNIPLQNIMAHGIWRSSAVWTYLQNTSQAPSIIPTTFASVISSFF